MSAGDDRWALFVFFDNKASHVAFHGSAALHFF
jgi:hypothetical protein